MKMLDPVTNVEVEDVLSSIRRLVSDDKRPSIASVATPSNDRLVLTPALRVAGSDEDVGETFPETKNQETRQQNINPICGLRGPYHTRGH